MAFDKNLNRLMQERNWTVSHLVAALSDRGCEVNHTTVQRWIDGNNQPRAGMVSEICGALGCEPNDLFADHADCAPTEQEA